MAKNEKRETTKLITKRDLLCILIGAVVAFCWGFFRGKGWLDWMYNLAPQLEEGVVNFIVAVIFALVWWAISAIYSAIRKKKGK